MKANTCLFGDCREILQTLPDKSVQMCVTSPPYFGLRDYQVEGQLGLEPTVDEYVSNLVAVFRKVNRILKDDGTLWLNLGSSYASGGMNPIQSPLLMRVPACGSDGKESQDSLTVGHVCSDYGDEPQVETSTRHAGNVRSDQSDEPSVPLPCTKDHDTGRQDSVEEPPVASLPDVLPSTKQQSSCQPRDAFFPSTTVSACQPETQTVSVDSVPSAGTTVCTSGTSPTLQPLVVRTEGKESFFSACHRSDCKGVGKCGLCWCSLAIPSLNVKVKDELNIPHFVAMALQADGWYLRQTLIWHKTNPMPESVRDRCTKSHEYLFLLSKSPRYYFDGEAIKEPFADKRNGNPGKYSSSLKVCSTLVIPHGKGVTGEGWNFEGKATGRNRRSVWSIPTRSYKGAHFACFPPALVEPCILAGSREGDVVLDPFFGSGTTGEVAKKLGRNWIGIELNPEYGALQSARIA